MKLQVFAVRDAKAETFSQPFFTANKGLAVRGFADECENVQSQMNKHPEDFSLFHLGEYDDNLGTFVNVKQALQIAHALDYQNKET